MSDNVWRVRDAALREAAAAIRAEIKFERPRRQAALEQAAKTVDRLRTGGDAA